MTSQATADAHLDALRSSATGLRDLASTMSESQLTGRAYPTDWNIAQVLSHLGSSAVIMQRRLEDALAGQATPDDYVPGVWNVWNAKTPVQQRGDALAADAALLARIEAVTPEERSDFGFAMGPMTFGFKEFVSLRLRARSAHVGPRRRCRSRGHHFDADRRTRRRQSRVDLPLHRETDGRHRHHHGRHC